MEKIPTIKELRETCGKKDANGLILRACDYLAVYPAKLFLYLPFTPNQITGIWILIKIVMALLLVTGGYVTTVVALLIFQLASIIDGVDGVVARFRKHFSLNGIYLDYFGHYFCNSLLLITLAIGTYNKTNNFLHFVSGALAVFSLLLAKALTINTMWYGNSMDRSKVNNIMYNDNLSLKNQKNRLFSTVFDFLRIDNPLNLMFFGIVFGYPGITLWIYAAFLFMEMARKLTLQFLRIYRAEKKEKAAPPEVSRP